MGKYVLAYKGGGGMAATEAERNAAMEAWGSWLGGLGDAVVDMGNPFAGSASVSSSGSNGAATSGLSGYTIVTASSLDDAVSKANGCPVFAAGGGVDVYETLEIM